MQPFTLFTLAGKTRAPPPLGEAVLILIDYQNEYLAGPLELHEPRSAVDRARRLLIAARAAGSRIIHVAHAGQPGSVFDRSAERGAIIADLAPAEGEIVVEKQRPNGFSGTDLAGYVGPSETKIIIAGFMTHNCVSSTARAALDLGYDITIAGDACATRDLPYADGVIPAEKLHAAELAALADHHAYVADVSVLIG